MRGVFFRRRKVRVSVLMLCLCVLCFHSFNSTHWMRTLAEEQVSEFLGNRMSVRIGEIHGGIFRDMVLQDVVFISGPAGAERIFGLERMEISCRVWRDILERAGFLPRRGNYIRSMAVYFSDENPFIRGFIKFYRYPGKMEMFGHVSPTLFGEDRKRGIKGEFLRKDDGGYDCDILWDGNVKITGTLDPASKEIALGFNPVDGSRGTVSVKGAITGNGEIKVYSRLDKADIFGTEVIGDLWFSYKDVGRPMFLAKAENLVINKRPFWGVTAGGGFIPEKKTLVLDNVRWGEGFTLVGRIGTDGANEADLKLIIRGVDLLETAIMLGNTGIPMAGKLEGEIELEGPINTASAKGRLYVSEGMIGNVEFRSIFATLEGMLPVIRITDSRVMKEGGYILVSGEMDFSRIHENKVFESVVFETDNHVAVWEEWQISKEEGTGTVEATRDRVTISTSLEDDGTSPGANISDDPNREVGLKYKLDTQNSLKLEFEEEKDFFGLEHKIQF